MNFDYICIYYFRPNESLHYIPFIINDVSIEVLRLK